MKGPCPRCGGIIEYETASAGSELSCPHCNELVRLPSFTAGPPPLSPTRAPTGTGKKSSVWIIVLVVGVAGLAFLVVFGLLAAIAIPNFIKARESAQRNACISNLRMIQAAKEMWAVENRKEPGDQPSDAELFGPGRQVQQKPTCPADGAYTVNTVGEMPACSIPRHSLVQP